MLQKHVMALGLALSISGVAFSQVNLRSNVVALDQGISNPYGNVSIANGETRTKKNFERNENMSSDKLNNVFVHWESVAPMWINVSISNGINFDIPPKTSSGSYPSGTFYIAEGYYDVTFTPYVENGYQDYLVGCEFAQDKRLDWTFYNVHISDECSDIVIGHGGSLH